MARLLLGQLVVAHAQVHLGERRDRAGRVGVVADLERDAERILEQRLRVLRLAEEEVDAAEVVQEPADALEARQLLVLRSSRARRTCARAPSGPGARRRARPGSSRSRARGGRRAPRRARARARRPRGRPRSRASAGTRASASSGCRPAAGRTEGRRRPRARAPAPRSPIEVWKLESLKRQTPNMNSTSARSTSENGGPSTIARTRASTSSASRTSPSRAFTLASLRRTRASSSITPVARTAVRTFVDLLRGLGDGIGLEQRLDPREGRLDPAALVGGDAVRQEAGVDAEPRCEPLDGLVGRARLAALDLAHVLLREPLAREVGLRQPRRDAKLAETLAKPDRARLGGSCAGAVADFGSLRRQVCSEPVSSPKCKTALCGHHPKGAFAQGKPGERAILKIT